MACSSDCCTLDPIELIMCPNYLLCRSCEPQDILDDNNGLCVYCCVMNGKLEFKEDTKCIICLCDNKIGVCFNKSCDHQICVDCYKKKYLVDDGDDKDNIFTVCCICSQTSSICSQTSSICSQTSNQDSLPK